MSLITSPIEQRFYFEAPRNSAYVNVKKCNFKEEYNPFSNNLYLNQRGVAKLVDIGHRAGRGTKYMGHYTEADLPPDYTIRDIAYALTSDTRIVTVGAKAPYLIENLVKMDGYWEAPKFRVGYHKDDIHPVTIKSESLNPNTAKIEFTSSIKLFLDWAYANNISLNMNPSHKLQVNYGKYIPPNNLLRKVGYIQVAGKMYPCREENTTTISWDRTPFSKYCGLSEEELSNILPQMTGEVKLLYVNSLRRYIIIEGTLPSGKRFYYNGQILLGTDEFWLPKTAYNNGVLPPGQYFVLNEHGDYLISLGNIPAVQNTVIIKNNPAQNGLIILSENDSGNSRWVPYDSKKLSKYKKPHLYLVIKGSQRYKAYDSTEPLEDKENIALRQERLFVDYLPKYPSLYSDNELQLYNKLMAQVNAGKYRIIDIDSEAIKQLIRDYSSLGFILDIYNRKYKKIDIYNKKRVLSCIAENFPEILICVCKTYFLCEDFSSLHNCIENYFKLKNEMIRKYILDISRVLLQHNSQVFKRIVLQSI